MIDSLENDWSSPTQWPPPDEVWRHRPPALDRPPQGWDASDIGNEPNDAPALDDEPALNDGPALDEGPQFYDGLALGEGLALDDGPARDDGLDESGEQQAWAELARWRQRLWSQALPTEESALVDLLRELENLKSLACATQARTAMALEQARHRAEADRGVPQSRRGIGISAEVALARRESPHRGGRLMGLARALVHELPVTLQALATGTLNEWRATLIARETACLEPADRRTVDTWLGDHLQAHPTIGDRRLTAEVRRKVIELDQNAVVRRRAAAAGDQRVTLQPLPDGMVRLSAVLPLQQGMAAYATLIATATHPGQPTGQAAKRLSRGKLMAQTLVELITGRLAHSPSDIELMIVITDQALLGINDEPAHIDGYGPMPASWVRHLISNTDDTEQRIAIRRLFRTPGRTTKMEVTRRLMSPALRRLIAIRDHQCRTPWCDAPIRHHDHIQQHDTGGPSSLHNGQGLCEACNYTKQQPRWTATPHQHPQRGHLVTLTTPTDHTYTSTQPLGPAG